MIALDRRRILTTACALTVANAARAESEQPAFRTGALAAIPFSKKFRAVPEGLVLPKTPLLDAHGKRRLSDLKGKIRLVSLWAEWCAPCLAEMSDLAALNEKFSARGFEVLAVMTSSTAKLDYLAALDLLKSKGAALPLWIEPNGGESLFTLLATKSGDPTLPCNLLIDTRGVIRGRAFGASLLGTPISKDATASPAKPHTLSNDEKASLMAGRSRTSWSSEGCAKFIEALISGALES
jgi:thiol-disulfide isomerase/thioredoxin